MDFITRSIEKSGVDEDDSLRCCADTFLEIHRCSAFFIHDADFESIWSHAEGGFDSAKKFHRKRCFIGTVHLGLYNVHRSRSGIPVVAVAV